MTATLTPSTTSRAANIALWVLQVLLAVTFLMSAFGKLTADPLQLAGFDLMGLGAPGMYLVGTAELLGAIGLLVPRLVGVAALALVALMIGAVILTIAFVGGAMTAIPATVLVLVAIVAWARRGRTTELLARR